MIEVSEISKSFDGVKAVEAVSLTVWPGSLTLLIGPNGSGKTTLLDLIGGGLRPDTGSIRVDEEEVIECEPFEISRRGLARTFQSGRLFAQMSVMDNLLVAFNGPEDDFVQTFYCRWKNIEISRRERARELLNTLGLAGYEESPASQLSFGQRKLLELGRVMITDNTRYLLLDEPTAGLHIDKVEQTVQLLHALKEKGKGLLVVEHDLDAIRRYADHIAVLNNGRKVLEGRPDDVLKNPLIMELYLGEFNAS